MKDSGHAAGVLFVTSIVQGMGLTVGWLLVHAILTWVRVHP